MSLAAPSPRSRIQGAATAAALPPASCLAASREETLLLSSAGDVLTCRCRDSAISGALSQERWTGYDWGGELAALCCRGDYDDLSAHLQETGLCGDFAPGSRPPRRGPSRQIGLLGGSPAEEEVAALPRTPVHLMETPPRSKESEEAIAKNTLRAFRDPSSKDTPESDEGSIIPIKSFDYSHFAEGGNDMLPDSDEHKRKQHDNSKRLTSPTSPALETVQPATHANCLIHGIPTFLSSFMNIKITQVSAHPLGSHVLLISGNGILFSYGLNHHGQLGIGIKSHPKDPKKGYIMSPTIVTPLLENGGKALRAAAGVDHSLVLVMTEESRIVKEHAAATTTETPDNHQAQTETAMYHQVYGFGRNDSMKLGLVNPKNSPVDDTGCVCLPKRVALRCRVRPGPDGQDETLSMGVFAIEASESHSAALVRRASGDVELFTWGRALKGALGLGSAQHSDAGEARPLPRVVPVPTVVDCLSKLSKRPVQTSLLRTDEDEFPASISLGRHCSFLVTSLGRCFSFGTSLDGMLGLGGLSFEADTPQHIVFPDNERIQSVSAGATHVLALTEHGNVYGWGSRIPSGFPSEGDRDLENSSTNGDKLAIKDVEWTPRRLFIGALFGEEEKKDETNSMKVAQVCAGFDSSIILTESGHVLSCGKMSGRLGLGEVTEAVSSPQPMFGGLRLWQEHSVRKPVHHIRSPPRTTDRSELKRGHSTLAF